MFNSLLFAHELTVKVSLSPAGGFEAKSAKLKGEIKKEGNKLMANNLWIKIEEMKTGIDLRDEHFHKYFNFEKFPKITFTEILAENGKGAGNLSVNNVKKRVSFIYKALSVGKIEATMKIKASDFDLKPAKYMEIGVDNDVEVVAILDI